MRLLSWRNLFFFMVVLFSAGMPLLSRSYGITWDEWLDSNYAMRVMQYILSGGTNISYGHFWHGYLYTELLFLLSGFLFGLFATDSLPAFAASGLWSDRHLDAFFQFSHALNSLFGLLLFAATGLCARLAGTWRTACFAFLLIALSPRFFGDAMNNPKDIPFAAAYMTSLLAMLVYWREKDAPRFRTMVFVAISFGLAIATRIGGVILMVYFIFFSALIGAYRAGIKKEAAPWAAIALRVIVLCAYGYLIGLVVWPYGQIHPWANLIKSLKEISAFSFSKTDVLFNGMIYQPENRPLVYLPVWILISTPLGVPAGVLFLFFLFWIQEKRPQSRWIIGLMAAAFLVPVFIVILKKSYIYNGWRHLYFVYGPMVVLSAKGWDLLIETAWSKILRALSAGFFAVLLLSPLAWMVKNHPFQSLYFNPFFGGIERALGRYETDYWGVCLKKTAEWLGDYHLLHYPDRPAQIRADGHILSTYPYLRNKLGGRYFPYLYPDQFIEQRHLRLNHIRYIKNLEAPKLWDYAIVSAAYWRPESLRDGSWPPKDALYTVQVDGVPLCVVVMNPESSVFEKKS